MPQTCQVTVHFQGEQHGKGPVDRLFGWGCAWIEDFLQSQPIHGIKDLVRCYRAGAQCMVNTDPQGPKFHIEEFDPGQFRPEGRTVFYCPGFLITRTYCLHSERAPGPSGVRIQNKVFSDSAGTQLRGWQVLPKEQDTNDDEEGLEAGPSKEWRRGFWNAEKSWEGTGPKPGEVNEVIRRHQSQKTFQPPVVRLPGSELERTLSAAAVRLQTAAAKKRRQNQRLRPAESSSSSSSNSSTSSSSESSAE